jgi:hypothetical protein
MVSSTKIRPLLQFGPGFSCIGLTYPTFLNTPDNEVRVAFGPKIAGLQSNRENALINPEV